MNSLQSSGRSDMNEFNLEYDSILQWLRESDPERLEKLRSCADRVRKETVGDSVHLRGIIEFSNHCVRECAYCGLRFGNKKLQRYRMSREEILECTAKAYAYGYGTVVLQSGEDPALDVEWLGDIVRIIKRIYGLAVTLSVGEHSPQAYRYWRETGADRYLLKFETSDENLLGKIHPPYRSDSPSRIELLEILKRLGYEIGGGIMVGLPGQTYESVARDIRIFSELDSDMIGIGPYIPHPDTPLVIDYNKQEKGDMRFIPNDEIHTNKVIALARLVCPEANIPATTALASVDFEGFTGGLRWGANVVMPNITPMKYRHLYDIYPDSISLKFADMHEAIMNAIVDAGRYPGRSRGGRIRSNLTREGT